MFPSSLKAVSIQVEHFYSLEFLPRNRTLIFFLHEEGICEQVLDFLHFTSSCFENSPLHIRKMRLPEGKTVNVGQLLHLYTDWKNHLQKCFLATRLCFFRALTTNVLHSRRCNSFVVLCPDIVKALISWAEKFSVTFSTRFIFEIQLH
jgi:hypothetical protein